MKHLLFVCTGNYYRSRTAEELFNFLATPRTLSWRADSRGLREDMSKSPNVGPMSRFAIAFLDDLKVPIEHENRMPLSLLEEDFQAFDHIICMDEREHRPMMRDRFPQYEDQVAYWQVRDVQFESPETALRLLKKMVEELVWEMRDK